MAEIVELQTRVCKNCLKRTFKVLEKSKQEFCQDSCELLYVKNSGNEELWKEKMGQVKQLGKKPIPMPTWSPEARAHNRMAQRGAGRLTQEQVKENFQNTLEKVQKLEDESMKDIKQKEISLDMIEIKGGRKMIQNTEQRLEPTKQNGIVKTEMGTEREVGKTKLETILSTESKHPLILVAEVTSQQMSFLDESAGLLMQKMRELHKPKNSGFDDQPVPVMGQISIENSLALAKGINELMRTKRESLKTMADIVKLMEDKQ
jgi:hypothetical protein